jgi:hypothetical protein
MGNDGTTPTPLGARDGSERWHSESDTVERRDRELVDRGTDREPAEIARPASDDDRRRQSVEQGRDSNSGDSSSEPLPQEGLR